MEKGNDTQKAGEEKVEELDPAKLKFVTYEGEEHLGLIIGMIEKELSEPYPIYTYRYFVQNWPMLTFLAYYEGTCVGCIVNKLDDTKKATKTLKRGYIAMLAVEPKYRKLGIGRKLVAMTVEEMVKEKADEVVLETEVTNVAALGLYESLGFIKDKRLINYYLNGNDAFKLKLFCS